MDVSETRVQPGLGNPSFRTSEHDAVRIASSITALILTFNEAPNLQRTLKALDWVERILIVDSISTDETLEIAASFPNAVVVQRRFDSFAGQCNFGLSQIKTDWVLSLDADYVLTSELISAILQLSVSAGTDGYSAAFQYCVYGKALRKTVLPPRTILYRRDCAHYENEGHSHRVIIDGKIERIKGYIRHDDRKSLGRWLRSQSSYMELESAHLLGTPNIDLNLQDRVRKRIFYAPILIFFYTSIVHRLALDGWHGWYYVCQRTLAELLLSIHLLDAHLRNN